MSLFGPMRRSIDMQFVGSGLLVTLIERNKIGAIGPAQLMRCEPQSRCNWLAAHVD